MHPDKVSRDRLDVLTDLPNVGRAMAQDLRRLGIDTPAQLVGLCPLALYERLCLISGERHDPCVLDVFMSITGYMNGGPARPWWACTEARKQLLAAGRKRA